MKKESTLNNLSRRQFIINSTGTGFATLLMACGIKQTTAANSNLNVANNNFDADKICTLTRTLEEGPFYIEGSTVRKNIRDDRQGQKLLLKIQLVDAQKDCRPIQNAVVSIWHCSAEGIYSGYENMNPGNGIDGRMRPPNGRRPPRDGMPPPPPRDGIRMSPPPGMGNQMPPNGRGGMHENPTSDKRYLRGVQITDAKGQVEFETIYPGWYAPRAVHIHTKIFLNDREMLTTQMFFPETLNNKILTTLEPYKARGANPFKTDSDGIAGSNPPLLEISEKEDTIIGSIIIVMKSA